MHKGGLYKRTEAQLNREPNPHKACGIYEIRSKCKPDKVYIGSSNSVLKRWRTHLSTLKRGAHDSILLQTHYNKYGEVDFVFSLLCECEQDALIDTEQSYMDSMNPKFNILKTASWHASEKLRKKRGKGYNSANQKKATLAAQEFNKKPVLQYTEDGVFIKEWPSVLEAANGMGYPWSTMQATVNHNECSGTKDGFYWCMRDEGEIQLRVVPNPPENKRLFQYDTDGSLVAVYRGVPAAVAETGFDKGALHQAANGVNYQGYGFLWEWEVPYMACYRKITGKKPPQELIDKARERYYMEYGAPNAHLKAPQGPVQPSSPPQGGQGPPNPQSP